MFNQNHIRKNSFLLIALMLSSLLVYGCSSGDGRRDESGNGIGDTTGGAPPATQVWKNVYEIISIPEAGGMLTPNVKAIPDSKGYIHIAYFDDKLYPSYTIKYLIWDPKTARIVNEESVISIENNNSIALALNNEDMPVIAYQGGRPYQSGSREQGDAMFIVKTASGWTEYWGGVGYVNKNAVLKDGLAGADLDVAVDSNGEIHLCYQFRYEGVSTFEFTYPDLLYVHNNENTLLPYDPNDEFNVIASSIDEETIEGNDLDENDSQRDLLNNAGWNSVIIMDKNDNPVVFYYAEEAYMQGLRVAKKQNDGTWKKKWIDTGYTIGDISASLDNDGNLAVAYYVESKNLLRYAVEVPPSKEPVLDKNPPAETVSGLWDIETVDESVRGGKHCSLSFDSSGRPAIAYYIEKTHTLRTLNDLRFARFDGNIWQHENVAVAGDIGVYNNMWIEDSNRAVIVTYSNSQDAIYLYYKDL